MLWGFLSCNGFSYICIAYSIIFPMTKKAGTWGKYRPLCFCYLVI